MDRTKTAAGRLSIISSRRIRDAKERNFFGPQFTEQIVRDINPFSHVKLPQQLHDAIMLALEKDSLITATPLLNVMKRLNALGLPEDRRRFFCLMQGVVINSKRIPPYNDFFKTMNRLGMCETDSIVDRASALESGDIIGGYQGQPDAVVLLCHDKITTDAAINLKILYALRQKYSSARIEAIGLSPSVLALYPSNPNFNSIHLHYPRHGGLLARLNTGLQAVDIVDKIKRCHQKTLVLDAASVFSQKGTLPIVDDDKDYFYFSDIGTAGTSDRREAVLERAARFLEMDKGVLIGMQFNIERHIEDKIKTIEQRLNFDRKPFVVMHSGSNYDYRLEGTPRVRVIERLIASGFSVVVMSGIRITERKEVATIASELRRLSIPVAPMPTIGRPDLPTIITSNPGVYLLDDLNTYLGLQRPDGHASNVVSFNTVGVTLAQGFHQEVIALDGGANSRGGKGIINVRPSLESDDVVSASRVVAVVSDKANRKYEELIPVHKMEGARIVQERLGKIIQDKGKGRDTQYESLLSLPEEQQRFARQYRWHMRHRGKDHFIFHTTPGIVSFATTGGLSNVCEIKTYDAHRVAVDFWEGCRPGEFPIPTFETFNPFPYFEKEPREIGCRVYTNHLFLGAGYEGMAFKSQDVRSGNAAVLKLSVIDQSNTWDEERLISGMIERDPRLGRIYRRTLGYEELTNTLVMDYIPGESLEFLVRRKVEDVETLMKIFSKAIESLELFSKETGIYHGDPNLGNWIVTPDGCCTMIDRRSSRKFHPTSSVYRIQDFFTLAYGAYEILFGKEPPHIWETKFSIRREENISPVITPDEVNGIFSTDTPSYRGREKYKPLVGFLKRYLYSPWEMSLTSLKQAIEYCEEQNY